MLHVHLDGIADVVGVLLDQVAQLIALEEAGILLILRVGLELQNDISTGALPLAGRDGIAVGAGGLPHKRLIRAVLLGDHRHSLSHHKGRIEAHAKLADDVHVGILGKLLLKLQRAALGDGTQVFLHLLLGHADAVIGDGEQAVLLVGLDGNGKVLPAQAHILVGERQVGQLVDGVGGVGDDLPEEDLLICIDRVNHQIQ